jgi:hypothetical protein
MAGENVINDTIYKVQSLKKGENMQKRRIDDWEPMKIGVEALNQHVGLKF